MDQMLKSDTSIPETFRSVFFVLSGLEFVLLRQLEKFNLLSIFYTCSNKAVLTSSITVCFGSATRHDSDRL